MRNTWGGIPDTEKHQELAKEMKVREEWERRKIKVREEWEQRMIKDPGRAVAEAARTKGWPAPSLHNAVPDRASIATCCVL